VNQKSRLTYPAPTQQRFRPSAGIPVDTPKSTFVAAIDGPFKKIATHPVPPLAIGAILALAGPSSMQIKSAAIIVCALWLSIDISIAVRKQSWPQHRKAIVFCVSTCFIFCAGMFFMYSFLKTTLDDQQRDTSLHLSGDMSLPPNGNAYESEFTIKNGGGNRIRRKVIVCYLVKFRGVNHADVNNLGEIISPDRKKMPVVTSKAVSENFDEFMDDIPIEPGGDAQTGLCLPLIQISDPEDISCIDVRILFSYQIENQIGLSKFKYFRYVANRSSGYIHWVQEPFAYNGSYCG
jgi:hypothetical protein